MHRVMRQLLSGGGGALTPSFTAVVLDSNGGTAYAQSGYQLGTFTCRLTDTTVGSTTRTWEFKVDGGGWTEFGIGDAVFDFEPTSTWGVVTDSTPIAIRLTVDGGVQAENLTAFYAYSLIEGEYGAGSAATIPPGVKMIYGEAIGAGGGGGYGADGIEENGGGGGGGGQYVGGAINVTPGALSVYAGFGGIGGQNAGDNGEAGQDSYIGDETKLIAHGGSPGLSTGAGGAGGSGAGGTYDDVNHPGGDGGTVSPIGTGGGGGAGGSDADGGDGNNSGEGGIGGTSALANYLSGGDGGTLAAGTSPGGGGSGGENGNRGKAGANGYVKLHYPYHE